MSKIIFTCILVFCFSMIIIANNKLQHNFQNQCGVRYGLNYQDGPVPIGKPTGTPKPTATPKQPKPAPKPKD